jgi:hypothetical protein
MCCVRFDILTVETSVVVYELWHHVVLYKNVLEERNATINPKDGGNIIHNVSKHLHDYAYNQE